MAKMSGGGERLRAAAERYPNPSTDWRILAKPLSEAFGFGRNYGTGTALAKNVALLGIADLFRDLESKRRPGEWAMAHNFFFLHYVIPLRLICIASIRINSCYLSTMWFSIKLIYLNMVLSKHQWKIKNFVST